MMMREKSILDQRLVLAHRNGAFAIRMKHQLQRLGWDVYLARSAAGARQLAYELSPAAIVLDTELPDESGWLMCKKLTLELPDARVILLGNRRSGEQARMARFVGASALVLYQDGLAALSRALDNEMASV